MFPGASVCLDYLHFEDSKNHFLKTTNRKITKISLRNMVQSSEINDLMNGVLAKHGHRIVKVSLEDCSVKRFEHFVQMLNLMPNLKKLSMKCFKGWRKSSRKSTPVQLAYCATLERIKTLGPCNECFMECFHESRKVYMYSTGCRLMANADGSKGPCLAIGEYRFK